MLNTAYRSKLPRGWSYPVGAERLSEWLEPVAGARQNALAFTDAAVTSPYWRHQRQECGRYIVLELVYSKPLTSAEREALVAAGEIDYWKTYTHAVPSQLRMLIRTYLLEFVLPSAREWLEATRRLGGHQGRGFFRVLYDQGADECRIESRLNDFDDPTERTCRLKSKG